MILAAILFAVGWLALTADDWLNEFNDGRWRSAQLELWHQTRDQTADEPMVQFEPIRLGEITSVKALGPGETTSTGVKLAPAGGWENSYSQGLRIALSELPDGWLYDGFVCTGPVSVHPYGDETYQLAYVTDEVGGAEMHITCIAWTSAG